MRLIHTTTLRFSEFHGSEIPPYAILSHTWASSEEEVSYKDYSKGLKRETSGNRKILMFCGLARSDNIQWAWVDTACIDKRSSAELSEAINSMFAWYRRAKVCYAYLSDVKQNWRESRWWSRRWCLQELIAPKSVIFFNKDWQRLGAKSSLADEIESLTKIPESVLRFNDHYKFWTVAQKMSWAAGRETTRVEDRAYSLLGIFHVNMTLLYGEEEKAFTRLQLEILQKYSDQSIMSWQQPSAQGKPHLGLARSPDDFKCCPLMEPSKMELAHQLLLPLPGDVLIHRLSNAGIEFTAHARQLEPKKPLVVGGKQFSVVWAIHLRLIWGRKLRELPCILLLVETGPGHHAFQRLSCHHVLRSKAVDFLSDDYFIRSVEKNKKFYLAFDADFASGTM